MCVVCLQRHDGLLYPTSRALPSYFALISRSVYIVWVANYINVGVVRVSGIVPKMTDDDVDLRSIVKNIQYVQQYSADW